MLSQLYIQNIAVIKEASIDLKEGFNVFTGETGAGKSMLIGAINAVLGERTSRDLIRTGETTAQVSALFTSVSPGVSDLLSQLGYPVEPGEELLISREISLDGKTVCRINGKPATASILRQIAGELIHIHGQHDNQQLVTPEQHLRFIDNFGGLEEELRTYQKLYSRLGEIKKQMDALALDESEKARKLDLLQYQIDEITAAELQPGEEEELLSQRKKMRNRERVMEVLSGAKSLIDGDDQMTGLEELLDNLSAQVSAGAQYMDELKAMSARLKEMSYEIRDYQSTLGDLLEEMDYDPRLIDSVEERLDLIYRLKKKYGSSVEEILEFLAKAQKELDDIQFSQQKTEQLETEYNKLLEEATQAAAALSQHRKAAGEAFTRQVGEELTYLDMPSVKLFFSFTQGPLTSNGMDIGQMMISTNPGEPPKPLAKIASGGELSRIMLSIKNTMADKDQVGTLIFDEIDTGVSGRAAQKIGQKLQQVAQNRQVICVTHLAQVAAYGNHHLRIFKTVKNERTFTQVSALSQEEREMELARMMGGDRVTQAALQNVREMLADAQKTC